MGKAMVELLRGERRNPHDSLAWELYGNRAIRQGDWKLVWGASEKKWELYNLKTDRSESNDLASAHPERVKAMVRDWEDWKKHVGL